MQLFVWLVNRSFLNIFSSFSTGLPRSIPDFGCLKMEVDKFCILISELLFMSC